jgi:hypothetical protein
MTDRRPRGQKGEKEGRRVGMYRCQTLFLRRPSFSLSHPRQHRHSARRDSVERNLQLPPHCQSWRNLKLSPRSGVKRHPISQKVTTKISESQPFSRHFTRKTRQQYNNYLLIFNNNNFKSLIINIQNIFTFLDN